MAVVIVGLGLELWLGCSNRNSNSNLAVSGWNDYNFLTLAAALPAALALTTYPDALPGRGGEYIWGTAEWRAQPALTRHDWVVTRVRDWVRDWAQSQG